MRHLWPVVLAVLVGCGPGEEPDPDPDATVDGPDTTVDAGSVDSGRDDVATAGDGGADQSPDPDMPGGPPVAADDFLGVVRGDTVEVDVLANDTDPDGQPLTVQDVDQPPVGSVRIEEGRVLFTAPAISQTTSFRYVVADESGGTDEALAHVSAYEAPTDGAPVVVLPQTGLRPEQLAVVVDESNPDSVTIGEHYADARGLPDENVIRVTLPTTDAVMPAVDFDAFYATVDAQLPPGIQAFALAWIAPYRVGCQSITTAFAMGGFDDSYCNTSGSTCGTTAPSSYYTSESGAPWDDHQLRPTMMLAATSVDDAIALIDRGVAADGTFPPDVGHLVRTTDSARSVRYRDFMTVPDWYTGPGGIDIVYTDNADGSGSNLITNTDDILFYFTGLTSVADLDTNTYRPGAVADHLTSFGGRLTSNGGQMSVVRWLEAGVTASFGTVVEPCNYTQKFPRVSQLVYQYYRGNSVVEAYWKSVNWPGEGVFVGEPLARPWGGPRLHFEGGTLTIDTTMMAPGSTYELSAADALDGPFDVVQSDLSTDSPQTVSVVVPDANRPVYRLSLSQ